MENTIFLRVFFVISNCYSDPKKKFAPAAFADFFFHFSTAAILLGVWMALLL